MTYDFAIIGGGASGCFSALSYLRRKKNAKVIILESNDSLLKKLQATGNGKCNFTNEFLDYKVYENGDRIKDILKDGKEKILEYFDYLNIKYYKDLEGRYYPISNSAKSVKVLIEEKLKELNCEIRLNSRIEKIENNGSSFTISGEKIKIDTKKLAICCGNKNYPKLGSDGNLFNEIERLGFKISDIYPSDIYIKVKEKAITKELSGERIRGEVTLINDGKRIYSEVGEILFKDDSISGIVTFNVSSRLASLYKKKSVKNPKIHIDFLNGYSYKELENMLNMDKFSLYSIFSPKLVNIFKRYEKDDLIALIKSFEFNITGLGDFINAQVASGGISFDDVNEYFESIAIKGLYFMGDILDTQAPCGGYNLSFAFLSGIKVGENL